ncbi:MAG: urease accessory protein UreD [Pseudomonadota bacterium]|nr:urease accessory protein UreD [Pseudomonadota bacterium]
MALRYCRRDGRTLVHDRHDGPLRVLKSLHPEGDEVCHSVLIHPPGGVVGGDTLSIDVDVESSAHALLTTPGATRFYRSAGRPAAQTLVARAAAGARLEWLPLETIAYSGCIAENRTRFVLAEGAEMIGWDVTALGLPASGQPFERGRFTQTIEIPDCWLERGTMHGDDRKLLDSPLGWAGQSVLATLWFATGSALAESRREVLLEAARAAMQAHALRPLAGVSAVQTRVVVARALASRVEPAMELLTRIWSVWRLAAWGRAPCPPRVWQT